MSVRPGHLLVGAALLFVIAASVLSARPWRSDERDEASPTPSPPTVALAREPFMGVACPEGNDIRCDRVKIAVWVSEPARNVSARIGKMNFEMGALALGDEPLGTFWQGVLQPAGLLDGPLRLSPDTVNDGRWFGEEAPIVDVRIEILAGDRTVVETVPVTLRPGYG